MRILLSAPISLICSLLISAMELFYVSLESNYNKLYGILRYVIFKREHLKEKLEIHLF